MVIGGRTVAFQRSMTFVIASLQTLVVVVVALHCTTSLVEASGAQEKLDITSTGTDKQANSTLVVDAPLIKQPVCGQYLRVEDYKGFPRWRHHNRL